jgi:predicted GNAT family acetyltransferase
VGAISRHDTRAAGNVPPVEFRNDAERGRYVLEDGGREVARTEYQDRQNRLLFIHTEVDPAYEGNGLAGQLVGQALDDVRRLGRTIVPLCAYVRGWIERHPEYDDLVDHELATIYLRGSEG